jgi:hypothetical protein
MIFASGGHGVRSACDNVRRPAGKNGLLRYATSPSDSESSPGRSHRAALPNPAIPRSSGTAARRRGAPATGLCARGARPALARLPRLRSVSLATTASRAARQADASRRPLTRRPLPGIGAPARNNGEAQATVVPGVRPGTCGTLMRVTLWTPLDESERAKWDFVPLTSVGPLRFGMIWNEVVAALGGVRRGAS